LKRNAARLHFFKALGLVAKRHNTFAFNRPFPI
jgi:hypothetical protein